MKPRDPELWSSDLDWLLNSAAALLGLRGTTGSVIACIERGGASVSGDHEHVTDLQLGWHKHCESSPEKYRRLMIIWRATPTWARGILEIHYATRSTWPPGVQGQLGQLAGVAMALVEGQERERFLRACERSRTRDLKSVLTAAEKAVRQAHKAWAEAQGKPAEEWAA